MTKQTENQSLNSLDRRPSAIRENPFDSLSEERKVWLQVEKRRELNLMTGSHHCGKAETSFNAWYHSRVEPYVAAPRNERIDAGGRARDVPVHHLKSGTDIEF